MSNCHVCFHYKGSPACVAVKATGEHCPAEPVTDAAIMTSAEKAAVVERRTVEIHDQAFVDAEGYVIILPRFEPIGAFKRFGRWMVFASARFDSFGIGWQILSAGLLIELGPFYFGICHIERQHEAYAVRDHMESDHG